VLDPKLLDEVTQRFARLLPTGAHEMQHEIEKNLRAVLNHTFAKLDLVTREEFEVQQELLVRTRSKLTTLENRIAELEAQGSEPVTLARQDEEHSAS
jgi:BMFP domain-containing protein YqiC